MAAFTEPSGSPSVMVRPFGVSAEGDDVTCFELRGGGELQASGSPELSVDAHARVAFMTRMTRQPSTL